MKYIKLIFFSLSILFFTQSCKKDSDYSPVQKTSLGVFNFFSGVNNRYSTYWTKDNNNFVWTYYYGYPATTYKVFDYNNVLKYNYIIPDAKMYPTGSCWFYNHPITDDASGNIQDAYISITKTGSISTWDNTYLKIHQIDKTAKVINEDSLLIHYSYHHSINDMRFTKTSSNYFFCYNYSTQDSCKSCGNGWFKDSLIILKTDLDLNLISKYEKALPSDSCKYSWGCSNMTSFDLLSDGNNLYLTYNDYAKDGNVLEIYDNNLNFVKRITNSDVNSNWIGNCAFQKIAISNGKLILFGATYDDYEYKTSRLLMSFFDLSGNFVSYKEIKPKASLAYFYNYEKCSDGKYLLYYSDAYTPKGIANFVGISKVDASGNLDYSFTFPKDEPSGYYPCYAYENTDGTINIFAYKNTNNNTGGQQTIVVKVDKTGKLQ